MPSGVVGWIHARALEPDRVLGASDYSYRAAVEADLIDAVTLLVPHELVLAQDVQLGENVSGDVGERGEVENALQEVVLTCVEKSEFEMQVFE